MEYGNDDDDPEEESQKSNVKSEDSEDDVTLSSKFHLKSSAGASVKKPYDSDEDKPLSSKIQQNGYCCYLHHQRLSSSHHINQAPRLYTVRGVAKPACLPAKKVWFLPWPRPKGHLVSECRHVHKSQENDIGKAKEDSRHVYITQENGTRKLRRDLRSAKDATCNEVHITTTSNSREEQAETQANAAQQDQMEKLSTKMNRPLANKESESHSQQRNTINVAYEDVTILGTPNPDSSNSCFSRLEGSWADHAEEEEWQSQTRKRNKPTKGIKGQDPWNYLEEIVNKFSPEFLCIVEPLIRPPTRLPRLLSRMGFGSSFVHNDTPNRVGNIWVFWKEDSAVNLINLSHQQITVKTGNYLLFLCMLAVHMVFEESYGQTYLTMVLVPLYGLL
ncbi:hypothetical protein IFM89_011499 [Coptis chinensis]|uniref:Uncharacterized protein n=1 Tax=Coptis chinensis TaxID=261450 RepID=A0A835I7B6_9MAGN|nr:hypothetical protein IFM89_011499 [Coptis chinensis]